MFEYAGMGESLQDAESEGGAADAAARETERAEPAFVSGVVRRPDPLVVVRLLLLCIGRAFWRGLRLILQMRDFGFERITPGQGVHASEY